MKKVLVSGVKPTGTLHIGNYFGAMKENITLGNSGEYDSYVFIADYHALTSVKNREELSSQTFDITIPSGQYQQKFYKDSLISKSK
jgi:tryptophanyl-tRNA synthetase